MNAVREYLLRLLACAFTVAVASVLVDHPRMGRLIRLCGGCLLAVVALQPLMSVPLESWSAELGNTILPSTDWEETAREQNARLMEQLVLEQTEALIDRELERLGIEGDYTLTLRYDEALGAPVPWSVNVSSSCGVSERYALSTFFSESLGIPEERQVWQLS